jgi:hypothetical protein
MIKLEESLLVLSNDSFVLFILLNQTGDIVFTVNFNLLLLLSLFRNLGKCISLYRKLMDLVIFESDQLLELLKLLIF